MSEAPSVIRRILIVAEAMNRDDELPPALALLRRELPGVRLCLWLRDGAPGERALLGFDEMLHAPIDWSSAEAIGQAVAAIRARGFDAAVILTPPGVSPYPAGYVCYLAGVPVRIGRSLEFGGRILSCCLKPVPNAQRDDAVNMLFASALFSAPINELSGLTRE